MLELRDVERVDGPTLHRWWEICHDAQSDRPVDYFPTWEMARVGLTTSHPDFEVELFAAYDGAGDGAGEGVGDGSRMVGAGLVNLPVTDNLHMAYYDVFVDWPDRRRGAGTMLLAEVERRARAAGRTRMLGEVFTPPGGTSAGTAFAEARGCTVGNLETAKAIYLKESESRWDALEEESEAALGGYRVLMWENAVPDEYAEGMCAMLSVFMGMVPMGDLDLEDGEWTVDRLRASERRSLETRQHKFLGAAVAPDGTLVGCTDVRLNTTSTRVGYVGLTMVMPEHRGHRLGLAMKLATHRALRAAYPECELVVTSNADVNDRMNAINEAMGYQVIEQLLEYQNHL
jgi:GNAT superfamily N-acetyltransferase